LPKKRIYFYLLQKRGLLLLNQIVVSKYHPFLLVLGLTNKVSHRSMVSSMTRLHVSEILAVKLAGIFCAKVYKSHSGFCSDFSAVPQNRRTASASRWRCEQNKETMWKRKPKHERLLALANLFSFHISYVITLDIARMHCCLSIFKSEIPRWAVCDLSTRMCRWTPQMVTPHPGRDPMFPTKMQHLTPLAALPSGSDKFMCLGSKWNV
jgi:hypothetical protein